MLQFQRERDLTEMPRQCWARSFSECRGKASGEHLITKALFPSGLKVRGFPWCNGEVKAVGANALTAKVLCRYHNTELSELDSAALDVWCVLREIGNQVDDLQTVARIARIQPRACAAQVSSRRCSPRALVLQDDDQHGGFKGA